MKGELEQGVDLALASGAAGRSWAWRSSRSIREGVETVLFLIPIFRPTAPASTPASAALARARDRGRRRLGDLRRRGPGQPPPLLHRHRQVLIFVAAGLVRIRRREFGEAGLFANTGPPST